MKIEKIDINKIKPYEKNAKIHTPEQIEQIKKSIQEFGMNDPIAVWGKDNLIVEGHGRLEALKQLGYTEVECIRLDHLTDEERRAYTLAHNKLTMNTDFDIDLLNDELFNIDNIDMELFGFDVELPIEEHELTEDDYEVEVPEEPKAKPGDIYQLGDWTGGPDVDSGATNRKLGSDMAQSVTGGGLHGKDLSKADVSVNIYAFLKAQETGKVQEFHCAIGDEAIDGKDYSEIVEIARKYIKNIGGFEKFAEWGLF